MSDDEHDYSEIGFDTWRDWHTSIISACGFLITIPLVALSLLAQSKNVGLETLRADAALTFLSTVALAISLVLMNRSLHKGFNALNPANSGKSSVLVKQATDSYVWGERAFITGVALIALSVLVVAISF